MLVPQQDNLGTLPSPCGPVRYEVQLPVISVCLMYCAKCPSDRPVGVERIVAVVILTHVSHVWSPSGLVREGGTSPQPRISSAGMIHALFLNASHLKMFLTPTAV